MIYTRIDTYSVILYDCSILDIFEHLSIPIEKLGQAYSKGYTKNDVKIGDTFVIVYAGIRFECKITEFTEKHDKYKDSVIEIPFDWIRLYISGEGMDYINQIWESLDVVFDAALCSSDFWTPISLNRKVTRCDFAFDFVNYEGNEFERLRKIIASAEFDDNLSSGGRLYTGVGSGISYQYRGGKERTIYLGTTSADRMLRIYDKKFQLTDEVGNWQTEKIPQGILKEEIQIHSWYRIELQCRDNFADRYLISCNGDFHYIMGEISAFFDVRTKDGKRIAPLHKIFLWTQRTPIIQKANSAKPVHEVEACGQWIGDIACSSIITYLGIYGWEGFRRLLNNSIKSRMLQSMTKRHFYLNKVNSRLSLCAQQEGLQFDANGNIGDLIKMDDGAFYVAPFPINEIPKGPYVR